MAFYKKMKINFINKYIRRKKDKMLRITNKAGQLALGSASEEMKSQREELKQMYILDNSVFVSAEENEVSNHLILQTLLRCEKMERLRFYVYAPKGEILTLYQYLHRLFLCIYLILTFRQKEEDVPILVEILKESEQILITYAELLFEMNPYMMFLFTIFLNHDTQKYETYDMYKELYNEINDDMVPLSRKPKWKEHFVGKNEEFIYGMQLYLQFIFSESFSVPIE
jgi:hypothetical protein